MRLLILLTLWLAGSLAVKAEITPLPESEQAAQALKILKTYDGASVGKPPKKLYVAYFTPADREPAANYQQRLTAIMEDIQAFYRHGMEQDGFGPETFPLERDPQGQLVIHMVKGKDPESDYQKPDGDKILAACGPVLNTAGIFPERETVLIFCNLANWDETNKTFSHHSPYYGLWNQASGLCFAVDSAVLNLDDITRPEPILTDDEYGKIPLGKFNSTFIGGIAHELGHAFALPHCGDRWDQRALGTSLMGVGNQTYHDELRHEDKGSFLTLASAMRLASRPIFSGTDKDMLAAGNLSNCDLMLSTNLTRPDLKGRRGALHLEGTVTGTPPVYGVVAYFDSRHDGGYFSPTATAVPDAQGHFALEASDLAPTDSGDLRVEFCHANGAISVQHLAFLVDDQGNVDISQWQIRQALEPLSEAVAGNQQSQAAATLQALEASPAPDLAKEIGRKLAATINPAPKPIPAAVPPAVSTLALGDAQPDRAEVGWLSPTANRVPLDHGVTSPLLDCNRLYATGLFAHAPSKYVFNLGGKWKELSGDAGLQTLQQPYGSVTFIIKADGKEVFRSPVITGAKHAKYKIDVTGVKNLEMLVNPAEDNNHNDWGLWLDPTLTR